LKAENYFDNQVVIQSDRYPTDMGHKVIFPSSLTGDPRHMQQRKQVVMDYITLQNLV